MTIETIDKLTLEIINHVNDIRSDSVRIERLVEHALETTDTHSMAAINQQYIALLHRLKFGLNLILEKHGHEPIDVFMQIHTELLLDINTNSND